MYSIWRLVTIAPVVQTLDGAIQRIVMGKLITLTTGQRFLWPWLFKRSIALSTRSITIQRIRTGETSCTIHWTEIYLAPVVQTLHDSAIHRIKIYSVDNAISSLILICWIVIYPVDSAMQRLNNRGLMNSAIQPLNNRGQMVKDSTPTGSIWIFFSEPPESLTESNIFLMYSLGLKFTTTFPSEFYPVLTFFIACENIRFSSLFAAGDVSRNVLAAKSEEKRMFSQANFFTVCLICRI